jgi:serine-threonine kinase receptor-associated protein
MASNTSRKIPLICSGHSRPVPDLSYSLITEDGFFLISACLDGKPMLRNGVTGDWLGTFLGHKGAVWSANLNSKALQAATASADYTAKVWDALSGEELHTWNHGRIVKSINFSRDDKRVLTGAQDKLLRVYDLSKPEAEPQILEGHTQPIKVALWGLEPNTILSGGQDNALRIWDVRTLKEVKSQPFKSNITSVDISLDGKHVVVSYGKEVAFLNAETFDVVKTVHLTVDVNSACLSPDGNYFIVGGTDFWARVYDFNSNKELEILKGHHGPVHCVRFAPDGATFASGSEDGTIRLWQSGDPKNYGLWQESKETKEQAPNHSDHQ